MVVALASLSRFHQVVTTTIIFRGFIAFSLAIVGAGCLSNDLETDLVALYGDVAKYESPDRDPVIVIPGILGTRLVDDATGKVVWGAFSREGINPKIDSEARLLAIPMKPGVPVAELIDDTRPDGALESLEVELFPGVKIQAKAYAQILGVLGAGGYKDQQLGEAGAIDYGDEHYTCFQFDYDWRRSLVENAARLDQFTKDVRTYVSSENVERFGRPGDFEIDIVAHSLGALVTRYFLMYGDQTVSEGPPTLDWRGANGMGDIILIGPPNAGSAYSLEQATEGLQYAKILPKYEPALLSTLPVIFELMPRSHHGVVTDQNGNRLDLYNVETWASHQWGLMNPRQDFVLQQLLPKATSAEERGNIAREHLEKLLLNAKRVHEALDRPAPSPVDLRLTLWAGDAVDTPAYVTPDGVGGVDFGRKLPGDGLVARYSALADDRVGGDGAVGPLESAIDWENVTFLFASHLELTQRREFADSMLFELLEKD